MVEKMALFQDQNHFRAAQECIADDVPNGRWVFVTSQVLQPGLWVVGPGLTVTITAIYWTHSQESAWTV
jgi:hypothetical protein